jgi:hypothetical protein
VIPATPIDERWMRTWAEAVREDSQHMGPVSGWMAMRCELLIAEANAWNHEVKRRRRHGLDLAPEKTNVVMLDGRLVAIRINDSQRWERFFSIR